jgi:DNA-binding transcriptional regulator LsrR (DeoR family)
MLNSSVKPGEKALIIRIAWLYFKKGLTQQKISEMLDISRMQVQRSISKSKQYGIVRIEISDPLTSCLELEDELKQHFSLLDAVVTPSPQNEHDVKSTLGNAAAEYLLRKVGDNQVIGVGWGTTLSEMIKFTHRKTLSSSHVVSLIGGWTKKMEESPYEVADKLANSLNVPCYYISAPALADTPESREVITSEKSVNHSLKMAKNANLAILGIGDGGEDCSLVKAGFLSLEEVRRLQSIGTIGEICGQFYDQDGNPTASGFRDRLIGVDLDELKRIKMVIGVAGGENKQLAILGTLRGGYVNVLITDENTAKGVLRLESGEKRQDSLHAVS